MFQYALICSNMLLFSKTQLIKIPLWPGQILQLGQGEKINFNYKKYVFSWSNIFVILSFTALPFSPELFGSDQLCTGMYPKVRSTFLF